MMRSCALVALSVAVLVPARSASGGDPAKSSGIVDLVGAKVEDRPLLVSVPISNSLSLTVSLPPNYWMFCWQANPRPKAFDGVGMLLQYKPASDGRGYRSTAHIGSIPLPEAKEGESPEARAERGMIEFVATLGDKYKRQSQVLLTAPEKIKLKKSTLPIGGHKTPVYRTNVYNTKAESMSASPEDMLTGETLLVKIAAADRIAYVVVDINLGGAALEKVVGSLSVLPTSACNPTGRACKLVETAAGPNNAFVVRNLEYEDPPSFVPNYEARADMDTLHAADRIDGKGSVTASYRVSRRKPGEGASLDDEAKIEMTLMDIVSPGAPTRVELATKGAEAVVYSYKTKRDDKECGTNTAVFRYSDQLWQFTWWTFGDDALVAADRLAFLKLVRGMRPSQR